MGDIRPDYVTVSHLLEDAGCWDVEWIHLAQAKVQWEGFCGKGTETGRCKNKTWRIY